MDTQYIEDTPPSLEEFEALQKVNDKMILRTQIHSKVADVESLLGTTSDGVQLLLVAFSQLVVALNNANSLADVRAAAAPYHDLASGFLAKVESGEVKLPYQSKGLDTVVGEIENRATAVAKVLADATT